MRDDLRLALIQTSLFWENPEANLNHFEEKISKLGQSADVIILPEMFTTGFTMNAVPFAEFGKSKTVNWLSMMAKRSGALIVGSIIFKEEGKFLNRLFWVEPQGKILTYDKRHLFRMGNEHSVFSAGNGKLISTWMGWRICPLICYDLRFPVWSRNGYSEAGEFSYDLLIYVANWPAARNQAWETLVRARAIENLSYVAALNRIGSDGKQVDHIGNSSIIAPQGDLIQNLGSLDTVVVTQISKSVLLDYRQKFPAFLDADSFEIDVN